MPEFSPDAAMHHEHEVMVKALEKMEDYVQATFAKLRSKQGTEKRGADGMWPKEVFDPAQLKTLVNDLSAVLLPHLEHEEQSISAESMKKAGWSVEEMMEWPSH